VKPWSTPRTNKELSLPNDENRMNFTACPRMKLETLRLLPAIQFPNEYVGGDMKPNLVRRLLQRDTYHGEG
jgi:hypothetical protein